MEEEALEMVGKCGRLRKGEETTPNIQSAAIAASFFLRESAVMGELWLVEAFVAEAL